MSARADGWRTLAFCAPVATHRQAEHVQVAMILLFAAKIPWGATLASVMAAMHFLHEQLEGTVVEPEHSQSQRRCGGEWCQSIHLFVLRRKIERMPPT